MVERRRRFSMGQRLNKFEVRLLSSYTYAPLIDPSRHIRLLELLPGTGNEVIKARIRQVVLAQPAQPIDVPSSRLSLDEIRATLPPRWSAYEVPEGRYLFINDQTATTHWVHPDPSINSAAYELPPCEDSYEPKYEALSYAWGKDRKSQNISVRDELPESSWMKMRVTRSLMEALRHLRDAQKSRILWIDAICIDQNDEREKSTQVQRMCDIYRLAHRVVVWLGRQSESSGKALEALAYLGAQVEVRRFQGSPCPSPDCEERTWFDSEQILPYDKATWDAIDSLLSRPWFTRVWVVQELQLARLRPGPILQCGLDIIPCYLFSRAVYCLKRKHYLPSNDLSAIISVAADLFQPMDRSSVGRVLRQATYPRECRNPRDKIYGMLGLAPPKFRARIVPDYTASINDVYKGAFLAHMQESQRFELLWACQLSNNNTPSWVPDWTRGHTASFVLPDCWSAGASRVHATYSETKPNTLQAVGLYCATLSVVSSAVPVYKDELPIAAVRCWEPSNLDRGIYVPTGDPLRVAYALMLAAGHIQERYPNSYDPSFADWVKQDWPGALFGTHSDARKKYRIGELHKENPRIIDEFRFLPGRRAFLTHEGYMGLAPRETKAGDVVAILLGASKPLILRACGEAYQIVGDCYVYGLNDAIKLLGPLPAPWRVICNSLTTSYSDERHHWRFFNPETGYFTAEDPRLKPISGWERISKDLDGDDPIDYDHFRNTVTGEIINYDPRLEPEALQARGVTLTTFCLV